jgi:hypothetical protein
LSDDGSKEQSDDLSRGKSEENLKKIWRNEMILDEYQKNYLDDKNKNYGWWARWKSDDDNKDARW